MGAEIQTTAGDLITDLNAGKISRKQMAEAISR